MVTAAVRLSTLPVPSNRRGAALSQNFDMGDETLWNPSNGASRMFRRQVAVFEAEPGLPSA
ncbi:hypothetical protein E3E14_24525 [Streptomyces sp. ICN441]|uniref:Uncharacterized protein n=1 Tax=Streptomyces tirandamycinicus TaxID=2174846 RepID=A0A2S1T012_9ACTN|nr:hypothetical protein DDW44_26710 [Streptomyces tirandamycinicus]TFE42643.1 hypothetical protein E3E14_24525 [Streptomyces sp. ICN441]